MRILAMFVGMLIAASACTAFGGPPDEGPAEAGAEAGAVTDAPSDARANDAFGDDVHFCATLDAAGADCLDFDDGMIPGAAGRWQQDKNGNQLTIVAGGAHGSIGALSYVGERPQGGASVGASIKHPLGATAVPRTFEISAAIRPHDLTGASNYDLFSINASNADSTYVLQLELRSDGKVDFVEFVYWKGDGATLSGTNFGTFTDALPYDQWTDVRISVEIGGTATSTAQLTIGATVSKGAMLRLHTMTYFDAVYFGDRTIQPGTAYDLSMDDFTFASTQ